MPASEISINFIISFGASLLALFVALSIDRIRLPKINIMLKESGHVDTTYSAKHYVPGRAKHYRLIVQNKKLPSYILGITRQTALNCTANISFKGLDNSVDFSFKGRWASTPEVPMYSDPLVKIVSPDPVSIVIDKEELLDVFTKYGVDKEAYGWNNESYGHHWRVPNYKLERGKYLLTVVIDTHNGTSTKKQFHIVVADTIEDTNMFDIL